MKNSSRGFTHFCTSLTDILSATIGDPILFHISLIPLPKRSDRQIRTLRWFKKILLTRNVFALLPKGV